MSQIKPKLLIIDDEKKNYLQYAPFIREKFDIQFAPNGTEGLQVAREWQPDSILLDFKMPGMDGLEVLEQLKANPTTKDILIIMLSQIGEQEIILRAIRMGATAYVKRADGVDIMVATLERHIEDRIRERAHINEPLPEPPPPTAQKRIFLSYSTDDVSFATNLKDRIVNNGYEAWIDHQYIKGGQRWMEAIENALRTCHAMVLILSPSAVNSYFVTVEYLAILRMNKPLIPLIYKPCEVPFVLQPIQHINYHDNPIQGIETLIQVLRETLK